MKNNTIISVAVDSTVYSFDKLFDYIVPENLLNEIEIGKRVLVPFGRANSIRQALIFDIKNNEDKDDKLKSIISVLDKEIVLNDEMIKMTSFIKNHYFCTYFDAIKAMLPVGMNYKIGVKYAVSKDLGDRVFDLDDLEKSIVKFIISKGSSISSEKLYSEFPFVDESTYISMTERNILCKIDSAFRKANDKTVKMVRLLDNTDAVLSDIKLTSKQQSAYDTILTVGSASVKEISYYTGVTVSVIDSLVKKGIAEYFDDEVFRIPKVDLVKKKEFSLTDEQNDAYNGLLKLYNDKNAHVALLYGITGSGKTSVYFRLIEQVINDNKDVIVMVPEIALTPQLISVFKAHFSEKVAIFHSALSIGERLDEYKRVKKGLAKIVIGTRSAIFAPFNNLGLIIMDEEQEHTYKSECKPRYHARELSKFRCNYNNALLLLSSATPSVETYYNTKINKYSLFTLKNRYGKAVLPKVITVDMNEEIKNGNSSVFSNKLLESIEENLNNKKQTILLLNRRGHNTFITCRSCKEPLTCPNCSVTLTFHSKNNRLMCHYCGYSINVPKICPNCNSEHLRFAGSGTQKAEKDIGEIFENAKILRMDTDSTMSKSSHEEKFNAFSNKEYDILVGTQMVAKGLDFPDVTLVGILNADQMLFSDDYRSYENTFSMLTQVIGRSGRGENKGIAIIQSSVPDSPIIELSKNQDYEAFYNDEIVVRENLLYPPFVEIILVGFVSDNKILCEEASKEFTNLITKSLKEKYSDMPIRLLGPSPQTVVKVNNKYRYKLIIKAKNDNRFRNMLNETINEFGTIRKYSKATIYVDVAPLDL